MWRLRYFRSWVRWVVFRGQIQRCFSVEAGRWSAEITLWAGGACFRGFRSEQWGAGLWRYSLHGRWFLVTVFHVLDPRMDDEQVPF